ncbi:uncharacterized protein LOC119595451 [Penaeus monodon]|uniref:uncharacterized protein LOC119595451 n=1 Tax=Penaeus monodon TaxID=6687 RepID=UPI0018A6F554|nr:uncharacterized protein LOC119595451 [Penaeus monodon]
MRARAGQLPFTPGKKIKMAEGEGRTDGQNPSLARFRYTSNRPRLLPLPVPKGGSKNDGVLRGSKPSDQDVRNFSLAKNQPNLHHFFPKSQNGGGGGRVESATFDAHENAPEGFSSVEEREAFEDLVNTFGCENKDNFSGDFDDDDDDDLLLAEASMGEPRGDGEYDEAFSEPLGIEDDFCDRNPSGNPPRNVSNGRSRSSSRSPQNGGGAGRNSSGSPAPGDQHQGWGSGMNAGFRESQVPPGARGRLFQGPRSQGSASQSLPVGPQVTQGNQFQRTLSGQGKPKTTLYTGQSIPTATVCTGESGPKATCSATQPIPATTTHSGKSVPATTTHCGKSVPATT